MEHILAGHTNSGWRTGCKGNKKTLFPQEMTKEQIKKTIRMAYKNGKKIDTQGNTAIVRGEYNGLRIEMYVDTKNKIIKTAYPKP